MSHEHDRVHNALVDRIDQLKEQLGIERQQHAITIAANETNFIQAIKDRDEAIKARDEVRRISGEKGLIIDERDCTISALKVSLEDVKKERNEAREQVKRQAEAFGHLITANKSLETQLQELTKERDKLRRKCAGMAAGMRVLRQKRAVSP